MKKISVIVPCYNEEKIISKKIENCLAFNKKLLADIIVVDDNSSDNSFKVIEKFTKEYSMVKGLKNKYEKGKSGAVRTGIDVAKGDILLVTDSDIILDVSCLEKAVKYFNDKKIGGVTFIPKIVAKNKEVEGMYVSFYEKVNYALKRFQSKVDSPTIIHGQAMMFRKKLNLKPDKSLLGDDVDYANQIRQKGYRVMYPDDLYFYEDLEGNKEIVHKQKERRYKGVMQSLWKHRYFLFNPKYGLYGLICYPMDFVLYFLQPFIFFGIIAILLIFAFMSSLLIGTVLAVVLILLLSLKAFRGYVILNFLGLKCLFTFKAKKSSRWTTPRG